MAHSASHVTLDGVYDRKSLYASICTQTSRLRWGDVSSIRPDGTGPLNIGPFASCQAGSSVSTPKLKVLQSIFTGPEKRGRVASNSGFETVKQCAVKTFFKDDHSEADHVKPRDCFVSVGLKDTYFYI